MRINNSTILAAPVTPFHPDGEINCRLIEKLAGSLLERGVEGFYIGGRTGEGVSLTIDERKRVAESWRNAAPDSTVIVNVSHESLKEAQSLSAHARQIGADGISSGGGPSTYPLLSTEDLVAWCAEIAEYAGDLPYYFYYYGGCAPGLDGLSPADFCRLAMERIPNFSGIKYSHDALKGVSDCLRLDSGRLEVFFGKDEMLVGAMAMGCERAIGGTFNLLSPLACSIVTAFQKGDLREALAIQETMNECITILGRFGGLRAVKAAMPLIGLQCGPVRKPLKELTPDETAALQKSLRDVCPDLWVSAGAVDERERKFGT